MLTTSSVELEHACKVYGGGVRALDDLTLTIGDGEWVALMGSSGSGKTTLLNLLDGLDRPTSGKVLVRGKDLTHMSRDEAATFRREHIGLVFQQFHLVPYLTALENVMLAQYYHSTVDREEAAEALARVKMAERVHHLPSQLSGGEQQRVCIARALINDPQVILADEPTGNLDEANEQQIIEIFQGLHRQGRTIIVATHDPGFAQLAQRTIVLRHGRLVQSSPPCGHCPMQSVVTQATVLAT